MPLFKVNKQGEIELFPEVIQLCPVLKDIPQKLLCYLICAYDYVDSPWHRRPFEERKDLAKKKYLEENEEPEKRSIFNKAIEEYESCIYESRTATIENHKNKIHKFNNLLSASDNYNDIVNYDKSIAILQKRIDELTEQVKAEEEVIELRGKGKLSLIEKLKRSKKLWELNKKNG